MPTRIYVGPNQAVQQCGVLLLHALAELLGRHAGIRVRVLRSRPRRLLLLLLLLRPARAGARQVPPPEAVRGAAEQLGPRMLAEEAGPLRRAASCRAPGELGAAVHGVIARRLVGLS